MDNIYTKNMDSSIKFTKYCYIFLFIIKCWPTYAKMKLNVYENETISKQLQIDLPIYNMLPWDISLSSVASILHHNDSHTNEIPLIPIYYQFGKFNPCDEDTFTPEIFQDLIQHYYKADDSRFSININNETNYNWIALNYPQELTKTCNGHRPLHLLNGIDATLSAQKLGPAAFLQLATGEPGLADIVIPPKVDVTKRKVKGFKITIPAFTIKQNPFITATRRINFKDSLGWISSIELDTNPFSASFEPFGVYRMLCFLCAALSLELSVLIIKECRAVINFYKGNYDVSSRVALFIRMTILVTLLISGILRTLVGIDPFGAFYVFDFYAARIFANCAQALSVFSDILTTFYCYDVYNVFVASRQMKKLPQPILIKYKFGGFLIILFSFSMIGIDTLVLYLSLTGTLGGSTILVPAFYSLAVTLIVVVMLYSISRGMKNAVAATLKDIKECPTTSDVAYTKGLSHGIRTNTTVKSLTKIQKILRMRRYILGTVFGRIMAILALFLGGIGFHTRSPFTYCFTCLLMVWSNLFSCFTQVLAALQLPSGNSTSISPTITNANIHFVKLLKKKPKARFVEGKKDANLRSKITNNNSKLHPESPL